MAKKGVMVTREQLQSIEWVGECGGHPVCPVCASTKREGHMPDCWLAPPDETRGAVAMLDEMLELAESNVERAQRLRDNPEFVQGDRVSYAVQAGVWGSLAETLKTRRAGFPPAAQAPPFGPAGAAGEAAGTRQSVARDGVTARQGRLSMRDRTERFTRRVR